MTAATTRTLNRYRAALTDALGDYLTARVHITPAADNAVTATLRSHVGVVATATAHAADKGKVAVTIDHPRFAGVWPPVPSDVAAWSTADRLRAAWEARP